MYKYTYTNANTHVTTDTAHLSVCLTESAYWGREQGMIPTTAVPDSYTLEQKKGGGGRGSLGGTSFLGLIGEHNLGLRGAGEGPFVPKPGNGVWTTGPRVLGRELG